MQRWNALDYAVLLSWRNLGKEHIEAVKAFRCTTPEKEQWSPGRGRSHPFPFELAAQSSVRRLTVPPNNKSTVRLGYGDEGLVAVFQMSCVQQTTPQGITVSSFFINSIAVDFKHRRQGYGHEALGEALRIASGLDMKHLGPGAFASTQIVAKIHELNFASQTLFSKNGFVRDVPMSHDHYQWTYDEPVSA